MAAGIDLTPYFAALSRVSPTLWTGEVTELIGLLVESLGPATAIGDFCEIQTQSGRGIRTQVIGFRDGHVLSMPLEETDGLQLGDLIVARSDEARVVVGAMSRQSSADVTVVALIGERNREVRAFLEHDLGPEGMKRSVVVCATSDRPAPVRVRACFVALAIAEYFR